MSSLLFIFIIITIVIVIAFMIDNHNKMKNTELDKASRSYNKIFQKYDRHLKKELNMLKKGIRPNSEFLKEKQELMKKVDIAKNQLDIIEKSKNGSTRIIPINNLDSYDYEYLLDLERNQKEQLRKINEEFQQQQNFDNDRLFNENVLNQINELNYQNQADNNMPDQFNNPFPPF